MTRRQHHWRKIGPLSDLKKQFLAGTVYEPKDQPKEEFRPMLPMRHRDWNKATVGKGRNTIAMGTKRGTNGSLTFSIPLAMAEEYLKKYGDGLPSIHMKVIKRPDGFLLIRSKPDEWGRKFSPGGGNTMGLLDYRVFYDDSSYEWIPQIEPFGSTVVEAKIQEGGIWVPLPPVEKRNALMPYISKRVKHKTWNYHGSGVARGEPSSAPQEAPKPNGEGHMYLVMVPPERDEQFHMLLRFLKLEALKE